MGVCRCLVLGVVALLLVSCGDGGKKSNKSTTPESRVETNHSNADSQPPASSSSEHSPTAGSQHVDQSAGGADAKGATQADPVDHHNVVNQSDPSLESGKQLLILQHLQTHMGFYSDTLSADFSQQKLTGNQQTVQQGHLELKRPDHFLWETYVGDGAKDIDQQILGNGRVYWQNDPSLEQVLKRQVDLSRLPLIRLLLHNDQSLNNILQDFTLSEVEDSSGLVFVLRPKPNSTVGINQIAIRFKNKKLDQLTLTNSVTDKSIFTFTNQRVNMPIDDAHFCYSGKIIPLDPAGNPAPVKPGDCV